MDKTEAIRKMTEQDLAKIIKQVPEHIKIVLGLMYSYPSLLKQITSEERKQLLALMGLIDKELKE